MPLLEQISDTSITKLNTLFETSSRIDSKRIKRELELLIKSKEQQDLEQLVQTIQSTDSIGHFSYKAKPL